MNQNNFEIGWQAALLHTALALASVGEEVGLAVLSGYLSKKLGIPINLTGAAVPLVPPPA
jgi:hypothetical protein